ncbi:MAG: hypothetical protein COB85_09455 [Bacteroidetes bacterium]|nr:MAG: hypothetical protein COB85_09455 [Bacteroidota bacterium]
MQTDILIPIILFLAPVLSGSLVFLFKNNTENNIKLLLAFSGSYLFSISVLHLIPEIYSSSVGTSIGIFVLIGFFIQVLLEFFSGGIEHGHIHTHGDSHTKVALPILISLCIHAFMEGMPLANETLMSGNTLTLLLGIVLHKMPIAFVLMSLLLFRKTKTPLAIGILILFALAAPAGYAISSSSTSIHSHPHEITAIVVGILLHVSTTILFESSSNHRFNFYKIIIIIFGASLAFINM